MYETLQCHGCFRTWERPVVRGRKPRLCSHCIGYVVLPPAERRARPTQGKEIEYTDGGRQGDGYSRETNDCTVRAVAIATGATYKEAHTFLANNGRKPRKGVYFFSIVRRNSNKVLGHLFIELPGFKASKGLKTAMLRNPALRRGTWILHMTHHVATLKDGVLYDQFDSSRKIIDGAYKVIKER